MLLRIRHAGTTIRKKATQAIAWNDDHADVDSPISKSRIEMDHVHYEKIGPRRYLHFDPDANSRPVYLKTFKPVDIAADLLTPSAGRKHLVQHLTDCRCAVCINLLLQAKWEAAD